MHNRGFMHAEVSSEVQKDRQRARVTFFVRENEPYRLRNYYVDIPYEPLRQIAMDSIRSLIRPNMLFDVDVFDAERNRISRAFRAQGYFRFNREMLVFEADSALGSNQVDVRIMIREFESEQTDSIHNMIFTPYHIRNVVFSTNRNIQLSDTNFSRDTEDYKIIQQGNYVLISGKDKFLRLNTLINNTFIRSNELYSDRLVERTYTTLNALPPIRYVNIGFRPTGTDSLDCIITVVPAKLVSLTADLDATYTDGFWGIASNLGIVHRNVFGGAESLSLQGRIAYEWQGQGVLANELGVQAGLLFPNFLFPFTTSDFRRSVRASTEFTTSVFSQNRPDEFEVMRMRAGMKYRWGRRTRFRHSLDLLDISYVRFNITPEFWRDFIESNKFNRHNYENHLITRIAYGGIYTTFRARRPLQNHFSIRYNIETAGNALFAFNNLFNSPRNDDGFFTVIGNVPYAQYVRADFGINFHQIFDENNRFVYRLFVGAGTPFGNANVIPWERRYFAGGASSVRGWAESTLGPGSYQRNFDIPGRDYNQIGDIKLDLNFEYRYRMFGRLEGALFVDAGNIWTVRPYETQQGGEFRFNTFWQQLGISYGTGLRLDFSFVVFRLDLGIRLHDPALPHNQRWRTNLTTRDLALHFAIGYPF